MTDNLNDIGELVVALIVAVTSSIFPLLLVVSAFWCFFRFIKRFVFPFHIDTIITKADRK